MRTPLASIRMQAEVLSLHLPQLFRGYQLALEHGLIDAALHPATPQKLIDVSRNISHQVDRSNTVIDMVLASARMEQINTDTFAQHSAQACIAEALNTYPFNAKERGKLKFDTQNNFEFHGSNSLLIFVIFNLLKNSLYAINAIGNGEIFISFTTNSKNNTIIFTDTGSGIPSDVVSRIFDTFFTTKNLAGAGIGLAFCKRAMTSFGGQMHCQSVEGKYTTFTLQFPPSKNLAGRNAVSANSSDFGSLQR
jgi:two-component system, CAI-1 autoinducer sensor kinase/phosphatase CqsS